MSEYQLPDIGLTTCTLVVPGLGERCGAPVQLTNVISQPELRLTIVCAMGHEVSGTVSELFRLEDLARPAVLAIEKEEFRELAQIVNRYRSYANSVSASGQPLDMRSYDLELQEWATSLAEPGVISFELWVYVRDHWDVIDKPDYPDRTGFTGWLPDTFDPLDWA